MFLVLGPCSAARRDRRLRRRRLRVSQGPGRLPCASRWAREPIGGDGSSANTLAVIGWAPAAPPCSRRASTCTDPRRHARPARAGRRAAALMLVGPPWRPGCPPAASRVQPASPALDLAALRVGAPSSLASLVSAMSPWPVLLAFADVRQALAQRLHEVTTFEASPPRSRPLPRQRPWRRDPPQLALVLVLYCFRSSASRRSESPSGQLHLGGLFVQLDRSYLRHVVHRPDSSAWPTCTSRDPSRAPRPHQVFAAVEATLPMPTFPAMLRG